MNKNINIASNTDVLPLIGLGNRPSVAEATLFIDMKMIEDLGMIYPTETSKEKKHYAIYECPFCGKHKRARIMYVNSGRIKSCGCQKMKWSMDKRRKHGLSKHPLYSVYGLMIDRCYNDSNKRYHRYGGRGISVDNAWRYNFVLFYNWALSNGYKKGLQIDRINNNGNYEPNNCRFVTGNVNQSNRDVGKNCPFGYKGVVKTRTGKYKTVVIYEKRVYRIKGVYETPRDAAMAYNDFVVKHEFPHALNVLVNE